MKNNLISLSLEYDNGFWSDVPSGAFKLGICFEGEDAGPTDAQRNFYKYIFENIDSLIKESFKYISEQNSEFNESEQSLYSISFGRENEIKMQSFSLEFSDKDAFEIHTVDFEQGKPVAYIISD